ncbi:hypothetical protein FRC12_015804 [Ceratobasidium sp. 428]|nr:hypothetical protein FRC12_015804 [Ceratobasidium sp. 428]
MVAKQENAKPATQKTSQWLRGAQSSRSQMSRCVWVVGIILLLSIAGGIGVGWYFTHNNPDHTRPTAIGGSAEEGMNGHGTSSIPSATTSSRTRTDGLVKATHASTTHASAAAATPTAAAAVDKRGQSDNLERLVARAFGQNSSRSKEDTLPVVVKKVRSHQKAKRRAWDRLI